MTNSLYGTTLGISNEFEKYRRHFDTEDKIIEVAPIEIGHRMEKPERLKVASYCRVSTEEEHQLNSLENQTIHYTNLIRSNPEWEFAGVFTDRGKSGTEINSRSGFNRMIRQALAGNIDLILCKSISRFSRNVVDTLRVIRLLSENGTRVIFEKEKIDSAEMESEFLLTLLSLTGQEESNQTSQNITWAQTRRFQRGEVPFVRILGYQKSKEKEWIIDENEAEIVRELFSCYLDGMTTTRIAKEFIKKGYKKVNGREDWTSQAVRGILNNEKYCGDYLCQKTYTKDFLSHKSVVNNGVKNQYLIKKHHEAIIEDEIYQSAKNKLDQNSTRNNYPTRNKYPMTSRLKCSKCGGNYQRSGKGGVSYWGCDNQRKSKLLCDAKRIRETDIYMTMSEAFSKRYDIYGVGQGKRQITRLLKEIQSAISLREIQYNQLCLQLDKAINAEGQAILNSIDTTELMKNRLEVEKELEIKERDWELLDRDQSYRDNAVKFLEELRIKSWPIRELYKACNDPEFVRAWIYKMTVMGPRAIKIQWLNGEVTLENIEESDKS